MWNPFIWLSGADTSIIEKCPNHRLYEKTKFSGIGALVLIPAIVGFFSMTYAVSTISDDPWVYFGGGLVWSFIVLAIDRLLVSTTNKSVVVIGNRKLTWLSVLARYILAIFLGIAVSHPLVLRWFDESIVQKIEKMKTADVAARRDFAEKEKEALKAGPITTEINEKTALRNCQQKLLTNEQSGIDSTLDCGSTSARSRRGCGTNCKSIEKQINLLTKEIDALEKKKGLEDTQRGTDLAGIEGSKTTDIERLEKKYAKDYLARVDALALIENGDPGYPGKGDPPKPHVWWVSVFMLLFFIFVDIVPITMKLVIPMGEYELVRDTALFETQFRHEGEREAIRAHAMSVHRATVEARLTSNSRMEEINSIVEMTQAFADKQEKERIGFVRQMDQIRRNISKIRDESIRQGYLTYIDRMQALFTQSLEKSITEFESFLANLGHAT